MGCSCVYLHALVIKWRNKGVSFTIEYPFTDRIQITANILSKQRYVTIITDDLEYGCRCIDAGLLKQLEVDAGNDNHHANS